MVDDGSKPKPVTLIRRPQKPWKSSITGPVRLGPEPRDRLEEISARFAREMIEAAAARTPTERAELRSMYAAALAEALAHIGASIEDIRALGTPEAEKVAELTVRRRKESAKKRRQRAGKQTGHTVAGMIAGREKTIAKQEAKLAALKAGPQQGRKIEIEKTETSLKRNRKALATLRAKLASGTSS